MTPLNYDPDGVVDVTADYILARGGIVLETVDCRVCGERFVPHLVWPDAPSERAGLCETHFCERWRLT